MALTEEQTTGVIQGGSQVLGGIFQLFGRSQELKGVKYQSQAEMLRAMSEQKRLEQQERTKRNLIIAVVFMVIILAIIITVVAMRRKT
jgi:hypothetical protein